MADISLKSKHFMLHALTLHSLVQDGCSVDYGGCRRVPGAR